MAFRTCFPLLAMLLVVLPIPGPGVFADTVPPSPRKPYFSLYLMNIFPFFQISDHKLLPSWISVDIPNSGMLLSVLGHTRNCPVISSSLCSFHTVSSSRAGCLAPWGPSMLTDTECMSRNVL